MSVAHPTSAAFGAVLLCLVAHVAPAVAQRITSTSDQTLSLVVPFNQLTPGATLTPSATEVRFRLRSASITGYRLTASATFTNTLLAPVGGGATLTAGDVGVGITHINQDGSFVSKPRTDTIASGFGYDPRALVASNGLTPYRGAANGEATLQDIISGPGATILRGPMIAATDLINAENFLEVTLRFAVQRQYFTPDSVSAVITLTIGNQ